nr:hypothetical protein CFP56_39441 [Quercus suber]
MEMSKKLSKPESEKVEMVKMNPAAEGFDTKLPWLNKAKLGNVIPKKRKLVKKMVFERFAQFFSSSVASCCVNKREATPIHPHML